MFKNLKKRSEGFTIIEVLIVLAIAGLIMLIVFLAVPALQRNSRNTAVKNDVANALGGVAEFQAANSGVMPTAATTTAGVVTYTGAAGSNPTTARVQGATLVSSTVAAPAAAAPALGSIVISLGFTCTTTNTRAAAALYAIETTAGPIRQCQDS